MKKFFCMFLIMSVLCTLTIIPQTISAADPTPTPKPDLIITNIQMVPAEPNFGDEVKFRVCVKNIGEAATDEGTIIGVGFYLWFKDSPNYTYTDQYDHSLAPGASVVLETNGSEWNIVPPTPTPINGTPGPTPVATPFLQLTKAHGGKFTLSVYVDDVKRISESNENNNSYGTVTRATELYPEGEPVFEMNVKTTAHVVDGQVLRGTAFGSGDLVEPPANAWKNAFDGDPGVALITNTADGAYVGIDIGTPTQIQKISYYPWFTHGTEMVGGKFQGSNSASGPWTDIYTITTAPPDKPADWTDVYLTAPFQSYQFVRYLSPNGGYCRLGEIQFYTNVKKATDTPTPMPTWDPSTLPVEVVNVIYTNYYGTPLSKLAAYNIVLAKVSVRNKKQEPLPATLMFALYKDGGKTIQSFGLVEKVLQPGVVETMNTGLSMPGTGFYGYITKVFVMKSFTDSLPYSSAFTCMGPTVTPKPATPTKTPTPIPG